MVESRQWQVSYYVHSLASLIYLHTYVQFTPEELNHFHKNTSIIRLEFVQMSSSLAHFNILVMS